MTELLDKTRPSLLNHLFADVGSLRGVGEKLRPALQRLCGERAIDVLFHMPSSVIDRRAQPPLYEAQPDSIITAIVDVIEHQPPARGSKRPYKVICKNETGFVQLTYFNARKPVLEKILPVGRKVAISGKVERYDGILQMSHPDHICHPNDLHKIAILEPVYPLTYGLYSGNLRRIITEALRILPELPEWQDESVLKKYGWQGFAESIKSAHSPKSVENFKQIERLAYDELLAGQIALALQRRKTAKEQGSTIKPTSILKTQLLSKLPYSLTDGQKNALIDIEKDMASGNRMMRVVQGDVGCGKTIVALISILNAVESGFQCALMAPTDILARQHFKSFQELGIDCEILTGRDKGAGKNEILRKIEAGSAKIVIGTHALFQENMNFHNLALVIIDEQHRFGVRQRMRLTFKGNKPHLLMLSATPIPRTLAMTFYGDLDNSVIPDKPLGRKPIKTISLPAEKIADVVEAIRRKIADNNRVYWVCPLVEEDEELNLSAATERFQLLKKLFGNRVGMVHGKMKAEEKDKTMQEFSTGKLDILVATTVIEVGVNVPEATVMVIEHSERFGLAQLHQLRGRIDRGDKESTCILLYSYPISETGKSRIKIMRGTEDGFKIAEEDLRLRGSGDFLGTKQSGLPEFRFAKLPEHFDLMQTANSEMKLILNADPDLKTPRGQSLRTLLHLFDYGRVLN